MWISVDDSLPLENEVVETLISDEKGIRNEADLVLYKGLWFVADKSMYVYYLQTHWRRKH